MVKIRLGHTHVHATGNWKVLTLIVIRTQYNSKLKIKRAFITNRAQNDSQSQKYQQQTSLGTLGKQLAIWHAFGIRYSRIKPKAKFSCGGGGGGHMTCCFSMA
jgi:hypothetical protein